MVFALATRDPGAALEVLDEQAEDRGTYRGVDYFDDGRVRAGLYDGVMLLAYSDRRSPPW